MKRLTATTVVLLVSIPLPWACYFASVWVGHPQGWDVAYAKATYLLLTLAVWALAKRR